MSFPFISSWQSQHISLEFEFAATYQEAEKLEMTHNEPSITAPGLIPMLQPEQRSNFLGSKAPPGKQFLFGRRDCDTWDRYRRPLSLLVHRYLLSGRRACSNDLCLEVKACHTSKASPERFSVRH